MLHRCAGVSKPRGTSMILFAVIVMALLIGTVSASSPGSWDLAWGLTGDLEDVDFVDVGNGWAVGAGGTVLNTQDGGNTWVTQTSGTTQDLQSVSFADANSGWAVGANGTILETSDGGSN